MASTLPTQRRSFLFVLRTIDLEDQEDQNINQATLLNEYQAQSLTVSLRMLERILFSVDTLCTSEGDGRATGEGRESGEVREGALVSLANPLTPKEREQLAAMSRRAQEVISTLAERFALRHEMADLAREAHGRLVEMWATLEDARSHKLRGYGHVDPALTYALDPEIEELI